MSDFRNDPKHVPPLPGRVDLLGLLLGVDEDIDMGAQLSDRQKVDAGVIAAQDARDLTAEMRRPRVEDVDWLSRLVIEAGLADDGEDLPIFVSVGKAISDGPAHTSVDLVYSASGLTLLLEAKGKSRERANEDAAWAVMQAQSELNEVHRQLLAWSIPIRNALVQLARTKQSVVSSHRAAISLSAHKRSTKELPSTDEFGRMGLELFGADICFAAGDIALQNEATLGLDLIAYTTIPALYYASLREHLLSESIALVSTLARTKHSCINEVKSIDTWASRPVGDPAQAARVLRETLIFVTNFARDEIGEISGLSLFSGRTCHTDAAPIDGDELLSVRGHPWIRWPSPDAWSHLAPFSVSTESVEAFFEGRAGLIGPEMYLLYGCDPLGVAGDALSRSGGVPASPTDNLVEASSALFKASLQATRAASEVCIFETCLSGQRPSGAFLTSNWMARSSACVYGDDSRNQNAASAGTLSGPECSWNAVGDKRLSLFRLLRR